MTIRCVHCNADRTAGTHSCWNCGATGWLVAPAAYYDDGLLPDGQTRVLVLRPTPALTPREPPEDP